MNDDYSLLLCAGYVEMASGQKGCQKIRQDLNAESDNCEDRNHIVKNPCFISKPTNMCHVLFFPIPALHMRILTEH